MKVKDYRNMAFESACYRTPEYIAFERACRRELKKQCAERGINIHTFHGRWASMPRGCSKGCKRLFSITHVFDGAVSRELVGRSFFM